MIDKYLFKNILEYLKICNKCKNLSIYDEMRTCVLCKDYCCDTCKMTRDKTEYETTGLYCNNCHKTNFTY